MPLSRCRHEFLAEKYLRIALDALLMLFPTDAMTFLSLAYSTLEMVKPTTGASLSACGTTQLILHCKCKPNYVHTEECTAHEKKPFQRHSLAMRAYKRKTTRIIVESFIDKNGN